MVVHMDDGISGIAASLEGQGLIGSHVPLVVDREDIGLVSFMDDGRRISRVDDGNSCTIYVSMNGLYILVT